MALSLSAEQRSILEIFKGEELYVIPSYQRHYSWGYDECYTLYNDLMTAFKSENQEYFLGNLVLAKSNMPKYDRQVVDGQQRLTTVWIMLKVLSLLCDTINPLRQSLSMDAREGNEKILKIKSFDNDDRIQMEDIYKMTKSDFISECCKYPINDDRLEFSTEIGKLYQSAIYFFSWFLYYEEKQGIESLKDFANFLLDCVFLLPISLYDKDELVARNKAVTVFETLNNRGLDLENADLFKATMYKRAQFLGKQDLFMRSWLEFVAQCKTQHLVVDEVFRYYSHVIRGREDIVQMEIKLLDFFTMQSYSPLLGKDYDVVLYDLNKILEVLAFIEAQQKTAKSECGKWFQVISAYSNNYPYCALVVYLFENGMDNEKAICRFAKAVIRYAYSYGSSRSVKFGIYNIIASVANHRVYDDYIYPNAINIDFSSAGRIKEGFALIAYYMNHDIVVTLNYDRVINNRDYYIIGEYDNNWDSDEHRKILDSICNYVILDIPKVNATFRNRMNQYSDSKLEEVKELFMSLDSVTYQTIKKREADKRKNIAIFFNTL